MEDAVYSSLAAESSLQALASRTNVHLKRAYDADILMSPESTLAFSPDCIVSPPIKRRTDHSLGLHTQRFVELLYRSADGCMNLNDASVALRIKKRRLYDITNVLEGACIIRKISKNIVQLVQPRLPCNNCLSRYRSPGATHPSFPKYRMVKTPNLFSLSNQTFPTQPCADQLMEFSKQLTSSPTDSTPPALPTPVSGNSQFMNFISDPHPIAALTGAAPQIPQLSPVTHPMTPPPSVPSSFSQVEQYWNHVNVVDPAATAAAVGSLAEAF